MSHRLMPKVMVPGEVRLLRLDGLEYTFACRRIAAYRQEKKLTDYTYKDRVPPPDCSLLPQGQDILAGASAGYFIGSVDLLPDGNPLIGAVYHQTLETPEWWERRLAAQGLVSP